MRTLAAVLLLLCSVQGESWETLEQFVRSCPLIVKAKASGTKDREIRFKVLESWKGKSAFKDGEYFAYPGEHGVEVKDGQEIVFFFNFFNQSKRHTTSFPIKDGKLLYASTYDADMLSRHPLRRWYTVAEFRERVRILQLPMAATPDKNFRLQARGKAQDAAGTPLEFELERAYLAWDSSQIYFDEDAECVEAFVDGKPLPGLRAHASVWPTGSPRIQLYGLASDKKIDRLVIEFGVIHVVTSKAYHFEKLALGKSREFSAPPFSFQVEAKPAEAMVICGLVRDEKHRAIEKALGTQTLTPMWAFHALSLTDSKFRYLETRAGAVNHRGGAYGYALVDAPRTPLTFPLCLTIRIPTKIKKERIRFEFRDFKLKR